MTMPRRKPAAPSGGPTAAEKTWTPILADWKKSGLGVSEFCRKRRVRESAFWFWRKELPDRLRLRRERRGAATKASFRILPVRVVEKSPPVVPLEILSGGRTLTEQRRSVRVLFFFQLSKEPRSPQVARLAILCAFGAGRRW
jgi:hypothetical protein